MRSSCLESKIFLRRHVIPWSTPSCGSFEPVSKLLFAPFVASSIQAFPQPLSLDGRLFFLLLLLLLLLHFQRRFLGHTFGFFFHRNVHHCPRIMSTLFNLVLLFLFPLPLFSWKASGRVVDGL